MAYNDNSSKDDVFQSIMEKNQTKRIKNYTKKESLIIFLTVLITLVGFLLRTWRVIREGMPLAFDGYHFQKYAKLIYYDGWIDFTEIIRDPPGIYFIFVIAEYMLGLPAEPIMWSIFIFPQIACSLQLIIYFILARRLTQSRMIGLLSMFIMSFIGLIVYRNQNIAPETFVLGLVPYAVYFLYRYLETKDIRFLIAGIFITAGVTFIHHLSTLFILINWHVIIPYDFLYQKIKEKKAVLKRLLLNIGMLIIMDTCIVLVWTYVLKGYPFEFAGNAIDSISQIFNSNLSTILLLIGITIMFSVVFLYLFFNLDKRYIKIGLVVASVLGIVTVFIITMFFSSTTPDQSIIANLLAGTPVIVLAPFGASGLVSLPKLSHRTTRMIRGWLFGLIFFICVVAAIPIMSTILGRLALYIIPVGVLLTAIAFIKILKKVDRRKIKAIALTSLIGWTALTMTYAYPQPKNNWGQQEIYWDAEYSAVDFLILYSYPPSNGVWVENYTIQIDSDFRIGLIVEGYGGFESTLGKNPHSWLTKVIYLQGENLTEYVSYYPPSKFNEDIDYIYISDTMSRDGYITNWANYGTSLENWILKLPDLETFLSVNRFAYRIYNSDIVYLIYPKWA